MDTRPHSYASAMDWMNPIGGWQATFRWNQIAMEWMTHGWQQWLGLLTAWPMAPARDAAVTLAGATLEPATANAGGSVPAGTQAARNTRALLTEAAEAHPRGNDRARSGRKSDGKAGAKAAPKRASTKRASRPQAAARAAPRSRG